MGGKRSKVKVRSPAFLHQGQPYKLTLKITTQHHFLLRILGAPLSALPLLSLNASPTSLLRRSHGARGWTASLLQDGNCWKPSLTSDPRQYSVFLCLSFLRGLQKITCMKHSVHLGNAQQHQLSLALSPSWRRSLLSGGPTIVVVSSSAREGSTGRSLSPYFLPSRDAGGLPCQVLEKSRAHCRCWISASECISCGSLQLCSHLTACPP